MIEIINKEALIEEIPLFASLTENERKLISKRSGIVEYTGLYDTNR